MTRHAPPIDDRNLKRFEALANSRDGDGWNWAKGVVARLRMVEAHNALLTEKVGNQSTVIQRLHSEIRNLKQ